MGNSQTPYQIEFLGGKDNVYFFFTKFKVGYLVKFKPSFYVLDAEPAIADHVYELVIAQIEKPEGPIPPDERILYTIAAIAEDFFNKEQNIAIYVCDDSDGRGRARKRKFDGWFVYLNFEGRGYMKIDQGFHEADGFSYSASLIFKSENRLKIQIITALDELADRYNQPK
ncbi:hypothetical protein DR864_07930 [Runella rosea]|uniref:Uncharacterized protein n=1 Tax=Runella rosea TaxID=2259595 RepID=A0A344TG98_9BACT|nr:DUF6169 family protein [Runella rosea]AXE17669.1 hypothetical protein DR864_07930 [Runella rosea]